jgi:hypothetical protein
MSDEPPFKIHSPTKITLSWEAREMAAMNGMTDEQMCRHLLEQHRQREAGLVQKDGHDGA